MQHAKSKEKDSQKKPEKSIIEVKPEKTDGQQVNEKVKDESEESVREYSETSDGVFFSDDEQFNQLKQFIDARENTEKVGNAASVNNNEVAMSEEKEEGKRDVKEVNGLENVTVNDANRKEDASVNNNNKDSEAVMSEEMRDETGEVETELKETKNGSKEIEEVTEDASVNNKGNEEIEEATEDVSVKNKGYEVDVEQDEAAKPVLEENTEKKGSNGKKENGNDDDEGEGSGQELVSVTQGRGGGEIQNEDDSVSATSVDQDESENDTSMKVRKAENNNKEVETGVAVKSNEDECLRESEGHSEESSSDTGSTFQGFRSLNISNNKAEDESSSGSGFETER